MELEPARGVLEATESKNILPFTIRSHHLHIINHFLRSGKSAIDYTRAYYPRAVKQTHDYDDFFGSTQEQADKFIRYFNEFLEEFLQLPSDYPVKIVDSQKDKLCNGCAIGKHCSERSMFSWLGDEDEIAIRVFIKTAKKLSLEDTTVVNEIATYSNAKPRSVKSILTTAGTVKKIIQPMSRSFWLSFFSW